MKYRRSDYAKYATLATLALALTLTACIPAALEASTSITPAASEEISIPPQSPVVPVEVKLPEASAPSQESEPAQITVPAPAVVAPVIATPVRQAPVSVPAAPSVPAQPTVPAPQVPTPPAAPVVTPITPVVPATPHVSPDYPQIGTFTFPDGHISFQLPAGWTVQTEHQPNLEDDDYADEDHAVIAKIYNEIGYNVARIGSGGSGGVVAGPVNRTILDSQKLTAFESRDGASHFAFFKDEYPFDPSTTRYFMGVVSDDHMTAGPGSTSAHSFLVMDNGVTNAVAHIDVAMSPETAATWMKSVQYSNLKALFTSIKYAD
ncbi:hypothetical protein M1E17_18490 [Arthrobacter sp. D1-29]